MDNAERQMRKVVDLCLDCDCCRYMYETNCLFFPKLYALVDREQETGERITGTELRELAESCNYCALCPCDDVRQDILLAKTMFIERDGLPLPLRLLEDVERLGILCGAAPQIANALLQHPLSGGLIRKTAGIHAKRKLPLIPRTAFPAIAKKEGWDTRPAAQSETKGKKVAFFSGCTARRLFPEVAQAAVEVLQRNNITVYYPPKQGCCGMPSMLEGDRPTTLASAERTVSLMSELIDDGYSIVTSCPTCGYLLKKALPERAYYAEEYQALVGGTDRNLMVPEFSPAKQQDPDAPKLCNVTFNNIQAALKTVPIPDGILGRVQEMRIRTLSKTIYGSIMKNDGYFASLDPLKRIKVSLNCFDLGEFLLSLHRNGELSTQFGAIPGKKAYYAPCHQREQAMGIPYAKLMELIPDISMDAIDNVSYCCGLGGIMGFKNEFHYTSIQMGSRLMAHIKHLSPDHLVTDCLSCRLQFNQMSAYPVQHPIEVLQEAYLASD